MSMSILRRIAADISPGLRDALGNRLRVDRIRGLHLDVDAYWMAWFRSRWAERPWYEEFEWEEDWEVNFLHARPPNWDRHCSNSGYPKGSGPVIIRVIFREPADLRPEKERILNYENYPIVYESRPPCVGVSSGSISQIICGGGDSVGKYSPDTTGTLGGFLRDVNSGIDYMISCAHVMGSIGTDVFTPGPKDRAGGSLVGRVRVSELPPQNNLPACNNRSHTRADSLDLAVAEVDLSVQIQPSYSGFAKPQSLTPFALMKSGDRVTFFGKKSGRVDCELGSLCIYHEIKIDQQLRCFGDIFTVTWPKPWYVNTQLAKPGDSGAWILRSINGPVSWDGMLIACDGATAYACFADNIINSARTVIPGLSLVP